MNSLKVYRIITYILLPFGGLFAFNALSSILGSFTNPLMLLISAFLACVPIYIFSSSKFLFTGILKAKPCSYRLKEWIKANAVISILFAAIMLLASLGAMAIIQNPGMINQSIQQMTGQQKEIMSQLTPQQIEQMLKLVIAIMLPFSILLIIHIVLSFQLLKLYNYVFDKE